MDENIVGENVRVIPVQTSIEEKYWSDKKFGNDIIDEFLLENRNISPAITELDSIPLSIKFKDVITMAQLGDIKSVRYLLNNLTTDNIFTQERKNYYLLKIDEHLSLR